MPDLLTTLAFLEILKQGETPGKAEPKGVTTATAPPGTTAPMPAWGGGETPVPSSLPPFPGPGWVPDLPLSAAVIARASYWNSQLWNIAQKTIVKPMVQELVGTRWLTFTAAWHPGDKGAQTYMATEAWRLATDAAMPVATVPVVAPGVVTPPAAPSLPPTIPMPPAVGPEPAPGAWKTNAAYILRYQTALQFLSKSKAKPAWNPVKLDGKYGPETLAAVTAFQKDQALAVDGQCGTQTAASLDAQLGYGAVQAPASPAPQVVPPAVVPPGPVATPAKAAKAAPGAVQTPGTVTLPTTVITPGPLPTPVKVAPYPGPGAWQTSAPYIARYQSALTYLASANAGPWDPQGVDGKYGPNTTAAVKAFQTAHGLTADGECGASTAAALDVAVASVAAQLATTQIPAATSGVGGFHFPHIHIKALDVLSAIPGLGTPFLAYNIAKRVHARSRTRSSQAALDRAQRDALQHAQAAHPQAFTDAVNRVSFVPAPVQPDDDDDDDDDDDVDGDGAGDVNVGRRRHRKHKKKQQQQADDGGGGGGDDGGGGGGGGDGEGAPAPPASPGDPGPEPFYGPTPDLDDGHGDVEGAFEHDYANADAYYKKTGY